MEEKILEKRKYIRVDKQILSWYKSPLNVDKGQEQMLGRVTKNIGAGGILFETDEYIQVSTTLNMEMKLPGENELVKSVVRVVRVEELGEGLYDIGVAFVEMSEEDMKKIENYLKSCI